MSYLFESAADCPAVQVTAVPMTVAQFLIYAAAFVPAARS